MNHKYKKQNSGFTLIELLVAVSLMLILIGAIVLIFSRSTKIFNLSEANMTVMQNARVAFDLMGREIAGAKVINANPIADVLADPVANPLLSFQALITAQNAAGDDVTAIGGVNYSVVPVANSKNTRWRLLRSFTLTDPADSSIITGNDILCQFIHAPQPGASPEIRVELATYLDTDEWKIISKNSDDPNEKTQAVRITMSVTDIKSRIVRTLSRVFWVADVSN